MNSFKRKSGYYRRLNWQIFFASLVLSFVVTTIDFISKASYDIDSNKAVIESDIKEFQLPLISNNSKADNHVKFYTETFAGPIYVKDSGEIVLILPGGLYFYSTSDAQIGTE